MRLYLSLAKFLLITLLLGSSGCATYSASQAVHDPWEGYNRAMFKFNDKLDRYAMKPIAKGYKFVTPDIVEKGISNFFSNIDDVTVTVNDILQGKFLQAAQDSTRFLLNTTLGLGGFFDIATPLGLEKHREDFGQTLGKWGVAEGPYIVWPFLGPATVRSSGGRVTDWFADPLTYVSPDWAKYSLVGGEFVDIRAQLLEASNLLDTVFDPYTFMRDAYVLNRRKLAYDDRFPADAGEDATDELDLLDGDRPAQDELDQLDLPGAQPDALDELDELDEFDRLELDTQPAAPPPDELDMLDMLEELEQSEGATATQ
ncbi:MAG: VacJ family lipoprotein [Gammaproteobacteria bacterium]|nr:VacJ family lipoprotein [Gammaproteobacteria bacterium]